MILSIFDVLMRKVTNKQFIPIKSIYYEDGSHHVVYPNFEKIITKTPLQGAKGQLQLKVLFKKKGYANFPMYGYSDFKVLSSKIEYQEAKNNAFKSAYKLVPFSPDGFDIIGEKFIYVDSRNYPLFT